MKRCLARTVSGLLMLVLLVMTSSGQTEESAGTAPTLKVLTFNVWGIIGAKERRPRAEAIGRELAKLNPDVIALEEAFESPEQDLILDGLKKGGYPVADYRYFRHLYGSGVFFISRFKIESALFESYRVNCCWSDLERLGGKGIAYLLLQTPYGPLEVFHTHALSRTPKIFDDEGNFIPGDPKQIHRLLEMYQIDRFVRAHHNPRIRSFIAVGDFNVSPEMLEYQFLVSLAGFESSFEVVHPGENPSTFSKNDNWVKDDFSRIDHIFFKNFPGLEGFWVQPVDSKVVLDETITDPKTLRPINLSDHYGLMTEFSVIQTGDAPASPLGVVPLKCPCDFCPLDGYTAGAITLTADNLPRWRNLALQIFREDYDQRDVNDPLLMPMAELVAKTPGEEPLQVQIPDAGQDPLRARIAKQCGLNDQAPPPAETPPPSEPAEPPPTEVEGDRG